MGVVVTTLMQMSGAVEVIEFIWLIICSISYILYLIDSIQCIAKCRCLNDITKKIPLYSTSMPYTDMCCWRLTWSAIV